MSNQNHLIGKATEGFQLMYEDKELILWGNFSWKKCSEIVIEGDFIIKNLNGINENRHKIHKVLFCKKAKRLEVHLSWHPNFKYIEYDAAENQKIRFKFLEHQEIEMVFIITDNSIQPDPELECLNDKPLTGGSILIGKRP